jgi:hypothetical protein
MADRKNKEELNNLVDEITVDAYTDDEQLSAFRQAFEDEVTLPAGASLIGEPVTVLEIEYDGNERRGLTARCRRHGSVYTVAAQDLSFPDGSNASRFIAAYRLWLGVEPYPHVKKWPKAFEDELDISKSIELVALAVEKGAVSCRILEKDYTLTLRPSKYLEIAPGEIITVSPRKKWHHGGRLCLAGEIIASRTDIPALNLVPLRLRETGMWDPGQHYWGEPDEPKEPWTRPIIKRGIRPEYEMEQVLPGEDPDNPDTDPILEAVEMKQAGDRKKARRMLMDMLASDLRSLDAHAHLGNFAFDRNPEMAVRHYDMGVKIGELSLGKDFTGLLPWGRIDNRPFLRCLCGYGLCLWRFGRLRDAEKVFTRILWLNPTDNQGARFNLYDVKNGEAWHA